MLKREKIKRLKQLHHMLINHDKLFTNVGFDLNVWHKPSSCGTAACALGSAALYGPFVEQGLRMNDSYYGSSAPACAVDDEHYEGFDAGSAFFGLSLAESYFLFDPDQYRPDDYGSGVLEESDDLRLQEVKDLNLCGFDSTEPVSSKEVAHRVTMLLEHYTKRGVQKPMLNGEDY